MEFENEFRQRYRLTLHAARENDEEGVIRGLENLSVLFEEQFKKKNRDSIVVKATLSNWQEKFENYIAIIRKNGLKDERIQKFFGLIDDVTIPSFGDILSGKEVSVPEEKVSPKKGDIDITGIEPEEDNKVKNDPVEKPKIEALPPKNDTPIEPEAKFKVPEVPSFKPNSLREFIGQQHIVKVLLKEIAIAKNEGIKHLDNILLFGNPGLGKTTLMELIAKELGVKYEMMDCSQYRNSQQSLKALQNFLLNIARLGEPVVIAFDEIHTLTTELQESLLTLLENRVYVSPPDINGKIVRIPIEDFTFIAATTDDNKVKNTIKDRCLRLKFQMVDYTKEELRIIYKNKVLAKGLTITDDAIETCIPRSRGSIRYVNSFVEGLNRALYDDEGHRLSKDITLDVAKKFFEEKGINEIGLTNKDIEILNVINEDTTNAIGVEVLSARIGLDPKKYLSEYEPYLIKIGFISITGRGRILTEKARDYLK